MAQKTNGKPQKRGFACMTLEARTLIAAMGGTKTAKRHGKRYMAALGRKGRRKRTLRERREKREHAALSIPMEYRGA